MRRLIYLLVSFTLLCSCSNSGEDVGLADIRATNIIVNIVDVELNAGKHVELDIGETIRLKATVLPEDTKDKTVTWISKFPEIATVNDDGLVVAKKEGTVVIIVRTSNGKMARSTIVVRTAVSHADSEKSKELAKILMNSGYGWLSSSEINNVTENLRLLEMSFEDSGIAQIKSEATKDVESEFKFTVKGDEIILSIKTLKGFIEATTPLEPSYPTGKITKMNFVVDSYSPDKFVISFHGEDFDRKLTLTKQFEQIDFKKQNIMRSKLANERAKQFDDFMKKYQGCNKYLTLCVTKGVLDATPENPVKIGFNYSTMTSTVDFAYNTNGKFVSGCGILVSTETGFVSAQPIKIDGKAISSFKYNDNTNVYEIDENGIEGHFECYPMPQYIVYGTTDDLLSGHSLWMRSFFPKELVTKMLTNVRVDANKNEPGLKYDVAYLVTNYKRRQPLFNEDGSPLTSVTGIQEYLEKETLGDGILFSFVYAYQFYYYFVPIKATKIGEDRVKFVRNGEPLINMEDPNNNAPMLKKCKASTAINAFVDKVCEPAGLHVTRSEYEGSIDFDFRFLKRNSEWFMARQIKE
jgi:hypothetical protein